MDLIEELASFSSDPYGFVLWGFPWGEPDTELAKWKGPEPWQVKILQQLGEGLVSADEAIQLARTSGHGIGKSALVAWIILWAISTFEDTRGVVTANTENQLKTKTWVELAKWHRLFIAKHLFDLTATALFSTDPQHERTWRIDMVPWSERNTEAFAGLHNQGKRLVVIMDEASSIPDVIWETVEGALTDRDTQRIWCVYGNPTRNQGRFKECFQGGKFAHRWRADAIDSRTVSFTDKDQIQRWVDDYGEDSDFVRVRVRGVFPRQDAISFISFDMALEASRRPLPEHPNLAAPLIVGVDVGRFGDDPSVIYPRRGRDARSFPVQVLYGLDTMQLAGRIAQTFLDLKADMVIVDETGVGGGVVDRLRQLRIRVLGVMFSAKPDGVTQDPQVKYANKRAEIWGAVREWLPMGCIIDDLPNQDITLPNELAGPTYGFNNRDEIQLERKEDMKRRGVPSPNVADALAVTHAFPVYQQEPRLPGFDDEMKPYVAEDYDPFARERMMA